MRRLYTTLTFLVMTLATMAQGWPANYSGVMLQGFFWDSFNDTQWTRLEKQADDLAPWFNLVWIPQSGNCGGTSMGYDDLYWFNNYNSSLPSPITKVLTPRLRMVLTRICIRAHATSS